MSHAFQYRPRFVDIRVRPPKLEEEAQAQDVHALKPGERPCNHEGCRAAASTRAPKSRDLLSDHYWFCQAHAAEYNRTWNFFAGMSEEEIRERMADDLTTGGRPTWSIKSGGRNREAASTRGFFRDAFGIFGAAKARQEDDRAAFDRRLGRLERLALTDLDLDATATAELIRSRYLELVKRCHPDANGGDRSAEHKLQRVIKAYKTLRKAKLV
jgi:DnaJ domain